MADLVTLAAVEASLPLPAGNADEPLLAQLISAASAAIETACGRTFAQANYVETRDGKGGQLIGVLNPPIVAVSGITIDGEPVPASTAMAAGWFYSEQVIGLRGWRFRRGVQNVVLSYTGGFATIPLDLQQACIELVTLRYRERAHFDMSSKAIAGETTSFITAEFKPSTLAVVNRYKRLTGR